MDDLAKYRREIDLVDSQLKKLLKIRFSLAKQVGQYKKLNNMEILDSKREEEILSSFDHEPMKEVYQTILKVSKEIQTWEDMD
jgi:chorismate mutase